MFDDALKKPIAGSLTAKRALFPVLMAQPQLSNTPVRHRCLRTRSDGHILNNSPSEEASGSDVNYTAASSEPEEPCARPSRPKKRKTKDVNTASFSAHSTQIEINAAPAEFFP